MLASLALALLGLFANNKLPLENDGLISTNELPIEHDEIDIYQQALENPDLVGGDMLIDHDLYLGNAISDENYRWPGGVIPYVIDGSLRGITSLIQRGMQSIQSQTCARFVKRTNEKEYVKIFKGRGCFAAVGRNRTREQPQPLSLGKGCDNIGTIIHELGHVLGFYHEQNRSDRDDYLIIHMNNVKPNQKHNFAKLRPDQNILYNSFDYDSLMIYGNYAFSKKVGKLKTMEAKNGRVLLNPYQKSAFTASDIYRIKQMYKC